MILEKKSRQNRSSRPAASLLAILAIASCATAAAAEPLRVCATVPDLGSLTREIGADEVDVTVFAKASEDPHFVDARPSFTKALNAADLFVQVGFDLEIGWAPVLVQNARNAAIQPGASGFVDGSQVIQPLDLPAGTIDRAMGDVHPRGNPHYLLDPINGLKVAALLRDRLSALRPDAASRFAARYEDLKHKLAVGLAGEALASKYDVEKLALLQDHGKLLSFLGAQGDEAQLGGWWGALLRRSATKAVEDHRIWPYFAHRFAIDLVAEMEPKPGIPPTTRQLQHVVEVMRDQKVPLILAAAYYDPRHADFLARETGAAVVRLANQVGARPGTDDYLSMIAYNVEQVRAALAAR